MSAYPRQRLGRRAAAAGADAARPVAQTRGTGGPIAQDRSLPAEGALPEGTPAEPLLQRSGPVEGLATGVEGRRTRRGDPNVYLAPDEAIGTAGVAGIPVAPKPEGGEGPLAPKGVEEPAATIRR